MNHLAEMRQQDETPEEESPEEKMIELLQVIADRQGPL